MGCCPPELIPPFFHTAEEPGLQRRMYTFLAHAGSRMYSVSEPSVICLVSHRRFGSPHQLRWLCLGHKGLFSPSSVAPGCYCKGSFIGQERQLPSSKGDNFRPLQVSFFDRYHLNRRLIDSDGLSASGHAQTMLFFHSSPVHGNPGRRRERRR